MKTDDSAAVPFLRVCREICELTADPLGEEAFRLITDFTRRHLMPAGFTLEHATELRKRNISPTFYLESGDVGETISLMVSHADTRGDVLGILQAYAREFIQCHSSAA